MSPGASIRLRWLFCLWLFVGCTYKPAYEGSQCAADGERCPAGYACIEDRCRRAEAPVDPADEPPPENRDPADPGSGGLPAASDPTGTPSACPAGQEALTIGSGTCCLPTCDLSGSCAEATCGGKTVVCARKPGEPLSLVHWVERAGTSEVLPCTRSGEPALAPTVRCIEDRELEYRCANEGGCAASSCLAEQAPARRLGCGEPFGCAVTGGEARCRAHLKAGQPCQYNYDCDSFCCARGQANAVCVEGSGDACKIAETGIQVMSSRLFVARGKKSPHELSEWAFKEAPNTSYCLADQACDAGHCVYGGCRFAPCVDTSSAERIRQTYFCAAGNANDHLAAVTNPNLAPTPESCR